MYNKSKTIVIVLTSDNGWISVLDGEIINTHDQNPLDSYQSAAPDYDIIQIVDVLEYKNVIEEINYFFECEVELIIDKPMKTKASKRRQRRALANTQQNLAKKALAKEAKQASPPINEPEITTPEIEFIAPGPMNVVKSNNVKSKVMKTGKKAVVVTRVGTAKAVNLGVDILYFGALVTADLINYGGSKLVKAISNCEESVDQLMENRTTMVRECEQALLDSPATIKAYTANSFAKLQQERAAKEEAHNLKHQVV